MTHVFCQVSHPSPWERPFFAVSAAFDHHGATHLIRQRQSLDPTGFAEMPKAPPTPQSAAQALDAVGLDCSL